MTSLRFCDGWTTFALTLEHAFYTMLCRTGSPRNQTPGSIRKMKQLKQTTSKRRPPSRSAKSRSLDKDRWTSDEGLLTASEVARILHISRSQVYLLMDRGDLPGLKVGSMRRFRRADLRRYLTRQPSPIRR